MFTLIENGEVYGPQHLGNPTVLLANDKIIKIGDISEEEVKALGVEVETIDATGCYVTPGLIDPHQHVLGGSGEKGFASQTPEISASEIVEAGITTVVGCLGADTTMKTLPGLLAKVKGLKEEGLNAYMWSGGYNVPPKCITASIRDDIMFIEEVVGCGEVAIADERSTGPTSQELARIVHDAYVGGMLSNKAGVTHFHVGEGEDRLALVQELIEKHAVSPEWMWVTHITRSEKLMLEAIEFAKNGGWVDIDTVDENLAECLKFYLDHKGWEEKLTVSSDASKTSPRNLFREIRRCVLKAGMPLATVLQFVTSNTANVLKLGIKGTLEEGKAADVLVMTKADMELREVISLGRRLMREGRLSFSEKFLKDSNRKVTLEGEKAEEEAKPPAHFASEKARTAYVESFICEGK
jgi:beta-aspartyl-dipeptidase (metallo-type)